MALLKECRVKSLALWLNCPEYGLLLQVHQAKAKAKEPSKHKLKHKSIITRTSKDANASTSTNSSTITSSNTNIIIIVHTHGTAVCAGIYGLSLSMGNQFSTDYSATVGPISMISTADPHEISISIIC